MGKEGAERYRTENLPNRASCPGVYELAVIKLLHESDTEARKLGAGSVCVVYVGQSDNVRTRLQQYGRDGDHLENGCSNDEFTNCASVSSGKKPRLFQEIFSRGYGIAYRWTPVSTAAFDSSILVFYYSLSIRLLMLMDHYSLKRLNEHQNTR